MKALVFNGPRDIQYESFPDPSLASDNSVILKVERCSICGSDLHMYHGENLGKASYSGGVTPFCVGHEFTGEIVEVGSQVHRFRVGQQVLASGGAPCGKCKNCLSGHAQRCAGWTAFGLSGAMNGGQAEFVNVPMADLTLQPIPEGVTVEHSILLTDAMCTAYFGLTRTNLEPGDVVAVVGLGPIGLIGVELAFTLGASEVFAIDPVSHRRDHARALGATALDPSEALPVIMDKTLGAGVPRVFEASGSKDAVALAIKVAGAGSTASFVGLPQPDVQLPMLKVLYKDITIRAGVASVIDQWPHLIPLLQHGRLKAEGLFSHTMALSEGAEAYRMFDRREDNVLKIMMTV
ncbi:alcohol dehydrogenase catalytic domain-containing protein [Luminiphilus sp.]|nr:alcohol dehydrogenase catalytic domain-containing protein [Luminiphilus sp.]